MERNIQNLTKFEYKPFDGIDGFSVYVDNAGSNIALEFEDKKVPANYRLRINHGSMVPRDGLLVADFSKSLVKGKRVLDLGTGSGILAIHSSVLGASSVVGVDIDVCALEGAKDNALLNNMNTITWEKSDLFSALKDQKFDLILSNPPQLPMQTGLIQDTGGVDGRQVVEKIIATSPTYLNKNGILVMVLFDFLGIDISYSESKPLQELFFQSGFDLEIVARKKSVVRKGGQTEKSTDHILRQYPRYKFEVRDGEIFHEKLLVKASLVI